MSAEIEGNPPQAEDNHEKPTESNEDHPPAVSTEAERDSAENAKISRKSVTNLEETNGDGTPKDGTVVEGTEESKKEESPDGPGTEQTSPVEQQSRADSAVSVLKKTEGESPTESPQDAVTEQEATKTEVTDSEAAKESMEPPKTIETEKTSEAQKPTTATTEDAKKPKEGEEGERPPEVVAEPATTEDLTVGGSEEEPEEGKKEKKKKKKKKGLSKKDNSYLLDKMRSSLEFGLALEDLDLSLSGVIIRGDSEMDDEELEEEESYEEEEEEEEPEEIPIDREEYYEMYNTLEKSFNELKMKNNYLQRKLVDYYRKRRMYHVLKESEYASDTQQKYERKLDSLAELYNLSAEEKSRLTQEVTDMKERKETKTVELRKMFQNLQKKEEDAGKDLLTAKTGKQSIEKVVERLLRRQKCQMQNLIKLQLDYIKIRNKVAEKHEELKALDNLGDNLHLMDYEQLKVDNRTHQDKLEERENELILLRVKCQNAMQALAHKREKIAAVDMDIGHLQDRLDDVNNDYEECRERLNFFKQERDEIRKMTMKLKEDLGLLNRPRLLRDMEDAQAETEILTEKLEQLLKEHGRLTDQVKIVKKNLSVFTEARSNEPMPVVTGKKTVCKGRPALMPLRQQRTY